MSDILVKFIKFRNCQSVNDLVYRAIWYRLTLILRTLNYQLRVCIKYLLTTICQYMSFLLTFDIDLVLWYKAPRVIQHMDQFYIHDRVSIDLKNLHQFNNQQIETIPTTILWNVWPLTPPPSPSYACGRKGRGTRNCEGKLFLKDNTRYIISTVNHPVL